MDPIKEANYILQRFFTEWIAYYNVDGWVLTVTWDRSATPDGGWRLCAAHRAPLPSDIPVRVHAIIDRDEWITHYAEVVEQRAKEMYTMVVIARGC